MINSTLVVRLLVFLLLTTITIHTATADCPLDSNPHHTATIECPPDSTPHHFSAAVWHISKPNFCYYPEKYIPKRYICEVSAASPRSDDARQAVKNLVQRKGNWWCEQENIWGSKCTRVTDYKSASVAVCGRLGSRINCGLVTDRVLQLLRECAVDVEGVALVGGTIEFERWRIIVYHS